MCVDIEQLRQQVSTYNFRPYLPIIETGILLDSDSQEFQYDITHGWDIITANICDREWNSYYLELFEKIKNMNLTDSELEELLCQIPMEDHHWDWFKKAYVYHQKGFEWFFMFINDKPQGACLIYHPEKSIIDSEDIFYIHFIAVAPWNRDTPITKRKFKGIGYRLITCVFKYAVKEFGLKQGFALHSLPQAKGFYQKLGMTHYPVKDKPSMPYFELSRNRSSEILGVA